MLPRTADKSSYVVNEEIAPCRRPLRHSSDLYNERYLPIPVVAYKLAISHNQITVEVCTVFTVTQCHNVGDVCCALRNLFARYVENSVFRLEICRLFMCACSAVINITNFIPFASKQPFGRQITCVQELLPHDAFKGQDGVAREEREWLGRPCDGYDLWCSSL